MARWTILRDAGAGMVPTGEIFDDAEPVRHGASVELLSVAAFVALRSAEDGWSYSYEAAE